MSGVQTGSRLEQLERLFRRVKHELEQERARVLREAPAGQAAISVVPASVPAGDVDSLARLGVTAKEVRQWAIETGRILPSQRAGRLSRLVITDYAHAHQQEVS